MALRGLQYWALEDQGWNLRGTFVSDGGGGGTATYVSGGTVSCRLDPLNLTGSEEGVTGGRLSDRSTHKVTAEPSIDIDNADRFEIQGRGVYEVTAVHDRTGELTKVFEVVATS